MCKKFRYLN
ncbi:hypothetical protein vseg_000499 [Gypsophila vaccaria]